MLGEIDFYELPKWQTREMARADGVFSDMERDCLLAQ